MKIATNSDNNPFGMTNGCNTNDRALCEQYGEGFIGRVYRTALIAWAITALIVLDRFGLSAMVGLTLGTMLALGSLRIIELTVQSLIRPGVQIEAKWFTLLCFVKLPVLTAVMAGAVWAIVSGAANVFALVAGVAMVHAVILLKAVSGLLLAALPPLPRPAPRFAISDLRFRIGSTARDVFSIENPKSQIRNRAVVQPASD